MTAHHKGPLRGGVLTSIMNDLDTCTLTATRYDMDGCVADELTLTIHVPRELIATHIAIQALGGEHEKDAVKTAFHEALKRVFGSVNQ